MLNLQDSKLLATKRSLQAAGSDIAYGVGFMIKFMDHLRLFDIAICKGNFEPWVIIFKT